MSIGSLNSGKPLLPIPTLLLPPTTLPLVFPPSQQPPCRLLPKSFTNLSCKSTIVMEPSSREALFLQLSRTVLAVQQRPELVARITAYWEGELSPAAQEAVETAEELTRSFCAFVENGSG